MKAASRQLAAGLRKARGIAVTERRETVLTLDVDGRTFRLTGDPKTYSLPKQLELALFTAQSELVREKTGGIRFFPDGTSTGGRVTVSAGESKQQVDVDWVRPGGDPVTAMQARQRGFSLLEILVAFTILALSLGVLMQIFSGSLRNADVTGDQAQAVALAQSLLASAGVEATLLPGESTGVLDDKFRWLLRVSPFVQDPRPGETEAVRSPLPLDLWEVAVRVAWGGDSRLPERAMRLTTLRVQPATSP
jgi:prepilin-type N-terminal cleavage/methylation domain-containing protein